MNPFETVGFIGGGRVVRFLLEGWRRAGALPPIVRVCDPAPAAIAILEHEFAAVAEGMLADVAAAPLVVLAVHPPVLKEVLPALKGRLGPESILLSLAPKVAIASLQAAVGTPAVARMIPNAPSAIGKGFNPMAFAPALPPAARQALAAAAAPWGAAPEVPEPHLESYAILTALGPSYFWFQWQLLRELAGEFGLERAAADTALLAMLRGAADCLFAPGADPHQVMEMIPGKPLQEEEAAIKAAFKARLTALQAKLAS
ncbi:MAG: NAD(P)-binding domain-containing protein [Lentisphaeria bacterium]|jgi:pyrroline-5-carboxylate reductase